MSSDPFESSPRRASDTTAGSRYRAAALGTLTAAFLFSTLLVYHRLSESENNQTAIFLSEYHAETAKFALSAPDFGTDTLAKLQASDNAIRRIVVIHVGGTDELGIARGQTITFDTSGKIGDIDESDRPLAIRANKVAENQGKSAQNAAIYQKVEHTHHGTYQAAVPVIQSGMASENVVFVDVDPKTYRQDTATIPGWLAIAIGVVVGYLHFRLTRWRNLSGRRSAHLTLGVVILSAVVVFVVAQNQLIADYRTLIQDAVHQNSELLKSESIHPVAGATTVDPPSSQLQHDSDPSVAYLVVLAVLAGAMMLLQGPLAHLAYGLVSQPTAYVYVLPALVSTLLLVFVPFAAGIGLAFFDAGRGSVDSYRFVGLQNFFEILFPSSHAGNSFYFTLAVTLFWTISNVVLHLVIGLSLALILNRPNLRFRGVYRVLLIIPWAVPSYITALIWKGMFNYQYGAINKALAVVGFPPVDWFGQNFWTNFFANLATNVWLGFPFMMVVSLGALQSIPKELYEAASMDGASKLQQLRTITLPLLKPALFPAVLLGTIWTFNMFNVIYLVSGGGPDNQTNILITEAFYQFKVLGRYGFAAAYAIMIFLILLTYAIVTNRITKATEGSY